MKKYIFCLRNDLLSMYLYTFLIGLTMYLCEAFASLFILKNLTPSCKNKMWHVVNIYMWEVISYIQMIGLLAFHTNIWS